MKWLFSIAFNLGVSHFCQLKWGRSKQNYSFSPKKDETGMNLILSWPPQTDDETNADLNPFYFGMMTSSQVGFRGKRSFFPIGQSHGMYALDSGADRTRPTLFYTVSQRMWATLKSSSWRLQWPWARRPRLEADKKVEECTAEAIKSLAFFQRCQLKLWPEFPYLYNLRSIDLLELFCDNWTDFGWHKYLSCFFLPNQ